ncbi:hypothetical protein GGR54DRAFT_644354 [Hypoxylon sp. NC1633]|nr:hypothetical protein GGR54DRAFT_644354 [Hypoxylon sp. NC1633]
MRSRTNELKPGGSLVFVFVGQDESGRVTYGSVKDSFLAAMEDMHIEGKLHRRVVDGFHIPLYARTPEEVRLSLGVNNEDWVIHDLFQEGLVHPAIEELERKKATDRTTRPASEQEWIQRSKKRFLRDHRDEEVFVSFIYMRLQRR